MAALSPLLFFFKPSSFPQQQRYGYKNAALDAKDKAKLQAEILELVFAHGEKREEKRTRENHSFDFFDSIAFLCSTSQPLNLFLFLTPTPSNSNSNSSPPPRRRPALRDHLRRPRLAA